MESLFDALYSFALENRFDFYALRDAEERQENETMARRAKEELIARGMDNAAGRLEDCLSTLTLLDRRAAFGAGLSMGLELGRL